MFNELVAWHKFSTSAQHKKLVNTLNEIMKKQEDFRNVIVCREKLSPYWIAQWTDARGKRNRRSTKVPVRGGVYRGERLSAAQAERRALMVAWELAREVEEDFAEHDNSSVREVCRLMLSGKLGRVSLATYENARTAFRQFCEWLGRRADEPIRLVTRADVRAFVAARRAVVRRETVHKGLSVIRAAFAYALDTDIIAKNPCDGVKIPPDTRDEKVVHEAFTVEEVKLLIEKLPDEWASAVRCCLGTYGQRMGDILGLKWEAFDWEQRVVRMVTGKTGRVLAQPMQDGFFAWARARFEAAQEAGGEAAVWVHPALHKHSNPSYEFTQLVRLHGIGLVGAEAGGRRRVWHSKTFHSLRATVATLLQASGVSQGMAMELVGHESAAVHAVYIRPSGEQLREAAGRLPNFFEGREP